MNSHDKESMKMAMLKHEETFREQVCELHRLYSIQKILMKDVMGRHYGSVCNQPESRVAELGIENDRADLELTLGSRSYNQKKIKVAEPAFSGLSFSSSSTGSSQMNRTRSLTREELLGSTNQERLNNPPWIFQALSLKMT